MEISSVVIILLILFILGFGLFKKVDIISAFKEGAWENLKIAVGLLPILCFLMLTISMLRSSGLIDAAVNLVRPLTDLIGFPAECLPLAILRPISGSGALTVLEDILREYGPDSFPGLVASVVMGSTETTFYTVAVYSAAVTLFKFDSKKALIAALVGDFTALILSAFAVRLLL